MSRAFQTALMILALVLVLLGTGLVWAGAYTIHPGIGTMVSGAISVFIAGFIVVVVTS